MADGDPAFLLKRVAKGVGRRIRSRLQPFLKVSRVLQAWGVIVTVGLSDALRIIMFTRKCKRLNVLNQCEGNPSTNNGLRIAFVIPWFGKNIGGGAEAEARGLIEALNRHEPDIQIEVLSTTLQEFAADWNTRFHSPGAKEEDGILVRRFDATTPDRNHFHFLNGNYLMQGAGPCPRDPNKSPVPRLAEYYFLRRMIHSDALLEYIAAHHKDYHAFVLIPYMFSLTVEGCMLAGSKAMLIPCLHDERYAYMHIYRKAYSQIGAALCHVRSEAALFSRLYPSGPTPSLIGEQVDVEVTTGDADRFRKKYGISDPFVLYAGRQVDGKNLPLMVEYFNRFRSQHSQWKDLQFVLIGKGDLDYSDTPGIRSLGFVSAEDKVDAYRAADAFLMLSNNESFSIVIMEAWLQGTPVIVSSECAVTTDHVKDSDGGFAVGSFSEFDAALSELLTNSEANSQRGQKGREYVLANFTPQKVTARFREELERLVNAASGEAALTQRN